MAWSWGRGPMVLLRPMAGIWLGFSAATTARTARTGEMPALVCIGVIKPFCIGPGRRKRAEREKKLRPWTEQRDGWADGPEGQAWSNASGHGCRRKHGPRRTVTDNDDADVVANGCIVSWRGHWSRMVGGWVRGLRWFVKLREVAWLSAIGEGTCGCVVGREQQKQRTKKSSVESPSPRQNPLWRGGIEKGESAALSRTGERGTWGSSPTRPADHPRSIQRRTWRE
ncbi:uncharacterized protein BJ171DRAFT_233905 [Polychytrium aggregatum]|uniref:uncharacterized protein n=1 Tax=Polychytrium aggregatum TaxID=110093 RepID=UPI0022FF21E0|nr:uncharacterized protein BJ171DRAFT_233905 [Polychytrium aggregatum]KAI9208067.1 hypothetical protein BJ171DRAFT_233905 [Polychytrium aggregatum]